MNRPNIVVICCDQLAASALRIWGNKYAQTPNIDRLVESGVRFENAYCNTPLCQPSRASFWSGRLPHENGVISNYWDPKPAIPEDMETLGSVFAKAGYRNVHFGKMHAAGALKGFECADETSEVEVEGLPELALNMDTFRDRYCREESVKFLENYEGDAPYLMAADFTNPHNICGWIGAYAGTKPAPELDVELPPLPENLEVENFEDLPLPIQYICCANNRQAQMGEWEEEKIRWYLWAYHQYMTMVDDEIGHVLDALEKRDDTENTMIVFFADHGDSMGGRWMGTKHTSFYEETMHIPFSFCSGGQFFEKSGTSSGIEQKSVTGLCSLIDLVPTLIDLAGLEVPEEMTGKSLVPWLEGSPLEPPHDYVVGQWYTEWYTTVEPGRMIRTERYKYTHYVEGNGEEFYDLEKDPLEKCSLINDPNYAEELEKHRKLFQEYLEQYDDPFLSLEYKVDERIRKHAPGYRNHRGGTAASMSGLGTV